MRIRESHFDSAKKSDAIWAICVDTGGTFTDCVARAPDGAELRAKVLSSGRLRASLINAPDGLRLEAPWISGLPEGWAQGAVLRELGSNAAEQTRAAQIKSFVPVQTDSDGAHLALPAALIELGAGSDVSLEAGSSCAVELDADLEAPVLAAHLITLTPLQGTLPPNSIRLATTRGTNALLERKGVDVALFVTEGFADLMEIGDQTRPDLFALKIPARPRWEKCSVEVRGRLDAEGRVITLLDLPALRERAQALYASGVRSAAIALMHSYRNPAHEIALEKLLREVGFEHVSRSSRLAPRIKVLERAQTAVVDAYLEPVIRAYLSRVEERAAAQSIRVMTSAGGLRPAQGYAASSSLLCGPAAGVAGAAQAAQESGISALLSFDMGGTSTDVARWAGDFEYVDEHSVGGARVAAPALALESVAAGGGSICWQRFGELRVGPASAGADPGPACYGAGGPLTITDVNLLLGRLVPERFGVPVNLSAAEAALRELLEAARREGRELSRMDALQGFLQLANERMADAIRAVSLRKGFDPAEHALVAFGGAGGMHACAIAELLSIDHVLLPRDCGLLSARGLQGIALEEIADQQVLERFDQSTALRGKVAGLEAQALAALRESAGASSGGSSDDSAFQIARRLADLRLAGQDSTLTVELAADISNAQVISAFRDQFTARYGHPPPDRELELVSLRAVARLAVDSAEAPASQTPARSGVEDQSAPQPSILRVDHAPVYERADLKVGARIHGPAVIAEDHATTWLARGWRAEADASGSIHLRRVAEARADSEADSAGDSVPMIAKDQGSLGAIALELSMHRLMAVAVEMGEMLRRCALSTNIKERLDFSCAVLSARGELVVNAPHIPVHLGALGMCVRGLLERHQIQPGDVWVTNHPAFGGSHLPDVTLISPLHDADGQLLAFVASRAHHAELGGCVPGSMPPDATKLVEEGVVISPLRIAEAGEVDWQPLRDVLLNAPWPSRAVEDNIADLQAALAANRRGAASLLQMAQALGSAGFLAQIDSVADHAASCMAGALREREDGAYRATEYLDDGTPLSVNAELRGSTLKIDFAGSGGLHAGNLNATPAIVQSAVMYVLRLMVQESIPLNEGIMRSVSCEIPRGILNPHFPDQVEACPAVVGGNVETSQRLVDALLSAFDLCAGSQGTMNNVIFGNQRFSYYETIAGGSGASHLGEGASAVQIHMTNTRMTDSEVLEHRYPVRVERFAVRRGSGGAGKHRGGDGVIRVLRFLEDVELSLMSQHRTHAPYGLDGGALGALGEQRILKADGSTLELSGNAQITLNADDALEIRTPGGGGWGSA